MALTRSFVTKLVLSVSISNFFVINPFCLAEDKDVRNIIDLLERFVELNSRISETQRGEKKSIMPNVKEFEEKTVDHCLLPDMRRRFEVFGAPHVWPADQTGLTYKVETYTNDLTQAEVNAEFDRAFQVWTDVTPLIIKRITAGPADMNIQFQKRTDSDYVFPKPDEHWGLADAPTGGNAYFNDVMDWKVDTAGGVYLSQVAAHEFGHLLGLWHADGTGGVMGGQANAAEYALIQDDIDGIQSLFGAAPAAGTPACATFFTDNRDTYRYFDEEQVGNRLEFEVEASNDVFIGLSSQARDASGMYEIVIGGWSNQKTVIRKKLNYHMNQKVLVDSADVLSPTEFRSFWVSWADGLIEVGREGETALASWQDPDPTVVSYFGYATAWGSSGKFKFCF